MPNPNRVAEVISYTDYRAWCGACQWQGEVWPRRKDANADMRDHNKEFHGG